MNEFAWVPTRSPTAPAEHAHQWLRHKCEQINVTVNEGFTKGDQGEPDATRLLLYKRRLCGLK